MDNKKNFLYCNNTPTDLSIFHKEIAESLTRDGTLPEELADLLTVVRVDPALGNPDGSPRFVISAA